MSRMVSIKGKTFIENKRIAIEVIQEYRCGIYVENNQFIFKKWDQYDRLDEYAKEQDMLHIESLYSEKLAIYNNEKLELKRLRDEKNNENEKRKKERILALEKERLEIENEKKIKNIEKERIAFLERERLRIEEEKRIIDEERERLRIEEEKRIIDEERERLRIEEEKKVLREEKADLIIANAEKQGYKVKKEIRENNTIKLVLQRRTY